MKVVKKLEFETREKEKLTETVEFLRWLGKDICGEFDGCASCPLFKIYKAYNLILDFMEEQGI